MDDSDLSRSDILWNHWIRRVSNYRRKYGNLMIPSNYETGDGYKLGRWVTYQRSHKMDLSIERIHQLEGIEGWVWSLHDEKWDVQFNKLKEFVNENGHCKLPYEWSVHDRYISLRNWVAKQKHLRNKLSSERTTKLESLKGWNWDS